MAIQMHSKLLEADTRQSLNINLKEPLGYSLLNDAVRLVDEQDHLITGTIQLRQEEREFNFLPADKWKAGHYSKNIFLPWEKS